MPFFVYGTLLPAQPNFVLWEQAITRIVPATLGHARLFDMGHYPMLVEELGATAFGAIITIRPEQYSDIMERLDFLEGYDPAHPDAGEYIRVKRIARLNTGLPQAIWVYTGRREQVIGRPPLDQSWSSYCYQQERELLAWWANVLTVGNRAK